MSYLTDPCAPGLSSSPSLPGRAGLCQRPPSKVFGLLCLLGVACLLAGCTSYYAVTDPGSGREYLTTSVDRNRNSDAISFMDAASGAEVTLTSSEVQKIGKDEYRRRLDTHGES